MNQHKSILDKIKFVCPNCKASLTVNNDKFICQTCSKKWAIREGIPLFEKISFRPDLEKFWTKDKTDELFEKSRTLDWNSFKNDYFFQEYPHWYDFFFNDGRADGLFLVPSHVDSLALDLGCGWGTFSRPLSRRFNTVISVDLMYEKLKWINIWKEKENINNVCPILANSFNLPFPNNYFDLVVMNGFLEWAGIEESSKTITEMQIDILKYVFNLMKEGGYLYIGIENRYNCSYLLGEPDHNGLLFTSFMPRFLANFWSRIKGKGKYRIYTYSYKGYEKLLYRAGFKNIKFYFSLPGYNLPQWILPAESKNAYNYFLNNIFVPNSKKKMLLWLGLKALSMIGLEKLFIPSFSIICRK